jgi:hypothetical protein
MMCVEGVVSVPFCSAIDAPAPPTAWMMSEIISKVEKMMM